MSRSRRARTALAIATVVGLPLVACGTRTASRPDATAAIPATSNARSSPSTTPYSTTPPSTKAATAPAVTDATATCSDYPDSTNDERTTKKSFTASINHQSGINDGLDLALTAAGAKRNQGLLSPTLDDFRAMDGAYANDDAFSYGGAQIAITVANSTTQQIVIDDIRPVNMRSVCFPSGLLVLYGSEGGGDYIDMEFNLDAARPVAHIIDESENVLPALYFDAHTITVNPNDSADLAIYVNVNKGAYMFDLGVDYVLNGRKYTELISPDKGPFKVTASACPSPDGRRLLTQADVTRLKAYRFQKVRQRADGPNSTYVVRSVDPITYQAQCQTW